ncbi:GPW/gp25 family protein [Erwinia sp. 198]|uniref:GPW/gp25 family protein n=1 Tax=Erwinia sp. 198 TaxID=2022746 RepID=UPI000F65C4ED|nr:GPW/gp25 family protein [Erwinia sp. 198]RRZ88539.1 baseplate assembly protein [Erwinia sp. 198]
MMMYTGMNQQTGLALTDTDHIRQSVRDILLTPQGSRIARREYGSVLFALTDQPQNKALNLQIMVAVYGALSCWEAYIGLNMVNITCNYDGSMQVELTGQRADGSPLAMNVSVEVGHGSY